VSETVDDPSLSARFRARQAELVANAADDRTLADRLTRRALVAPTVTVDAGGPDDPIEIEVRVPVMAEVDFLSTMQARQKEIQTVKEYDALMSECAEILGRICTDPSLDAAFWRSGMFTMDVMFSIVSAATEEAADRLQKARSFRHKAKR
jgi:pantoate kinase